MNFLAIIPARGGSKGIPRKNIKKMAGNPLIYYTINEAKKAKYLTRIVVSTEDKKIAKISKKYGVDIIHRPKKLANDKTPSELVCQHVIKYLKNKEDFETDVVVVLQPTSPLRKAKDINSAIKKFLKSDCSSVVSITKAQHSPYWMYKIGKSKMKKILTDKKITRRQDSPIIYQLNGAIYVTKKETIMKENTLIGKNMFGYIMPYERSIDIDSQIDFDVAELLINKRIN